MNWDSTKGKSGLIKMLMQTHGISKRKAEKAVNAVFDCMSLGLRRDGCVELSVGVAYLASQPAGREKRVIQRFSNIQTGAKFSRVISPPERIIRFRPDPELIQRPPFPPPPPHPPSRKWTQKVNELVQLLTQLGFPDLPVPEFKYLYDLVDYDMVRLLARLRELVREGRKFPNLYMLCDAVVPYRMHRRKR